jgi:hypothetical protein
MIVGQVQIDYLDIGNAVDYTANSIHKEVKLLSDQSIVRKIDFTPTRQGVSDPCSSRIRCYTRDEEGYSDCVVGSAGTNSNGKGQNNRRRSCRRD